MIEQDTVDSKHAISFPVLLGDPEAVLLGNGIGGIGMEGRGLPLGDLLHLAVKLGGGGLVEFGLFRQAQDPDRLQHPQDTQCVHIAGVLGHIKADLHMALGSQIVDLVRLNQTDDPDQAGRIGQVTVVKGDLAQKMLDAAGIGNGCPAGDAVDFITLFQQELRKIRTVLAGDAGDQCFFHNHYPPKCILEHSY